MKYSLHIGLNSVDPFVYFGWSGDLAGCENDAHCMATIADELGYQVSMLLTDEASVKRVLDAFHHIALLAAAGDTVLITYSGHGGQLPDKSGDESDGLDETWVLYDGMILDDLLHQAYAAFRKGVRIIVLSDSCHSGTVIKMARQETEQHKQRARIKSAPAQVCKEYASTFTPKFSKVWRPRVKASVILISGCQDNQFSYDGDDNGLFTGTLLKVYYENNSIRGYRDLRKKIVKLMPPEQTPQFLTMGAKDKFFESSEPFRGI